MMVILFGEYRKRLKMAYILDFVATQQMKVSQDLNIISLYLSHDFLDVV